MNDSHAKVKAAALKIRETLGRLEIGYELIQTLYPTEHMAALAVPMPPGPERLLPIIMVDECHLNAEQGLANPLAIYRGTSVQAHMAGTAVLESARASNPGASISVRVMLLSEFAEQQLKLIADTKAGLSELVVEIEGMESKPD